MRNYAMPAGQMPNILPTSDTGKLIPDVNNLGN